jgi:DNA-3-methyladenine glycosylase
MRLLPPEFYHQDTIRVARELIGCYLIRRSVPPAWGEPETQDGKDSRSQEDILLAARIVETEAYLPDDPASHSFNGPTARASVMFEAGGLAYVYFIYGMHHCFNVVTGPAGYGSAVLIRAAEPVVGIEQMEVRRGLAGRPANTRVNGRLSTALTNGPGKLCQAFGITRDRDNAKSLRTSDLVIALSAPGLEASGQLRVGSHTRIGITKAQSHYWRFVAEESPFLSR